jgi:hypothetical protein
MVTNGFIKCGKDSIVVIFLIVVYACLIRLFVNSKEDDPLVQLRAPICGNFLNGWTTTHFLFFSYLGFNYSNYFEEAMILGILWELFEFSVGEFLPVVAPNMAFNIDPKWQSWYYGCYEDIVANAIGFQVGKFVKKLRIKNKTDSLSVATNHH